MRVFRLSRKKYPLLLSGKGAAISGARWNSAGIELIYTAESRALAVAEVSVHLSLTMLPYDFIMLSIDFPETISIIYFEDDKLPPGWNEFPYIADTQSIGDKFVQDGKACVMRVPSAVVPGDFNYLINTAHKDFSLISVLETVDFIMDRRLFEKLN